VCWRVSQEGSFVWEVRASCVTGRIPEQLHWQWKQWALPFLASFSMVIWSSPTHLLFPLQGKSVSTYSIFRVEYMFHFIILYVSIYLLVIFQSQIYSNLTWCGFRFTQSVFENDNCFNWQIQHNSQIDIFYKAKVQESMSCCDTFTVNI